MGSAVVETLITAAELVEVVLPTGGGLAEVVGDKVSLVLPAACPTPRDYPREVVGKVQGYHSNALGLRLLRQRGERLERPTARLYETGRLSRVHLRGHANILKRLHVHVCGLNLGLLMRRLTGVGTPRGLQGRAWTLIDAVSCFWSSVPRYWTAGSSDPAWIDRSARGYQPAFLTPQTGGSATGC